MFFKIYIFLVVFSIGFLKTDEVSVFPLKNKQRGKKAEVFSFKQLLTLFF